MRQEQALKSDTTSHMDMTSKSKILEQMQLRGSHAEDLGKTTMSDQLLDRMRASAEKKARLSSMREQARADD